MANILRDNTAPLWRPDLYKIFTLLSLTQTPVKINTRIMQNGVVKDAITLTGCLTKVKGLESEFTVNYIDYPEKATFLTDPACEYFAVLATPNARGNQLVEYSGNARILDRTLDAQGRPEYLKIHFSLPGRMRPLRKHTRQNCEHWDGVLPGLALLTNELTSRRQLLALMRHYYTKKTRIVPQLINISPGGVCLLTEDAIARRLMQNTDRYLFFFFVNSPLQEKTPLVFQGRKAGTFKMTESNDNGLRIQFLKELNWSGNGDELNWQNITNDGSDSLKRILHQIPAQETDISV